MRLRAALAFVFVVAPSAAVLAAPAAPSADAAFFTRASTLAISSMRDARLAMQRVRVPSIAAEAVRAFNSSAVEFNGLSDIAVERGVKIDAPRNLFSKTYEQVTPVAGAVATDADLAYLARREASLTTTVRLYRAEAANGRDPVTVAFAKRLLPRLINDLSLATMAASASGR